MKSPTTKGTTPKAPYKTPRRLRGFERTSSLVQTPIRKASEKRGFAESRLLTHWIEIVGEEIARIARPVKVSYSQGGFGATLTVLTTGAQAPMLAMEKEKLRDRVNACYGYAAIARIHITQTAPIGFAEGQVAFAPAPKQEKPVDPVKKAAAQQAAANVTDDSLRRALEALGENVLSRTKPS